MCNRTKLKIHNYTLVFAFSKDMQKLVVIKKTSGWQKDSYNAIGDKFERPQEKPLKSAIAHFNTFTNIEISEEEMLDIGTLYVYPNDLEEARLNLFTTVLQDEHLNIEHEVPQGMVQVIPIYEVTKIRRLNDLPMLIEAAKARIFAQSIGATPGKFKSVLTLT